MAIPFIDLGIQRARIGAKIESAVLKVINHGAYIMGPEVKTFEADMAKFAGAKHALSCANGTDAIELILLGLGIGKGDAVFVPAFTFVATAEVVPMTGAEPVFVDIDGPTYNIDAARLEAAILAVKAEGRLKPAAIIAVDLFGQPADYPALSAIAKTHGLHLICDSAQGFGGTINGVQPQMPHTIRKIANLLAKNIIVLPLLCSFSGQRSSHSPFRAHANGLAAAAAERFRSTIRVTILRAGRIWRTKILPTNLTGTKRPLALNPRAHPVERMPRQALRAAVPLCRRFKSLHGRRAERSIGVPCQCMFSLVDRAWLQFKIRPVFGIVKAVLVFMVNVETFGDWPIKRLPNRPV